MTKHEQPALPENDELTQRYQQVMMNTFGVPQKVLVKGEGVHLWDADGKEYLDLLAGIAVSTLGHANQKVNRAISKQLGTLGQISNYFASKPQIELAEKLAAMVTKNSPELPAKVFFTNSGTEANEAAFKVSRMTGRKKLVAMEGSFHGRTLGSLAVTWHKPYREPFEPLPGFVEFVPYGNATALAAAVDASVAAVVIEPIQGENGVVEPPDGFLARARQIADEVGALLWLDEVQSGMGRTGTWLASEPSGVTGDIVTFAKALGNGFPIGACVATGKAAELLKPGNHGTTFGGNPVAAAAALATIDFIEREGLMAHAAKLGERVKQRVEKLNLYEIETVRGQGLLLGIKLRPRIAAEISKLALEQGIIVNAPRPDVLRLIPPLIITAQQLDKFVDKLPALIKAARQ
jgi:acetylornithine aminotransferase